MSSAILTAGQARINELRGLEQPLVLDKMIFALIPGLDDTAAVDRSMALPQPSQIVHEATIDSNNKGYVGSDQVVYSVILGSDIGNWSFNMIGLVEAVTGNLIAVSTMPETPKRKTNLAINTTGNMITRNFVLAFQDAQNLTAINVSAETWQFDYLAELGAHADSTDNPHDVTVSQVHGAAGRVDFFAMQSPPAGWLKCNGASVSRATYADLFAAIGITYGNGNGATTFNLPDLRSEFVRGWDDGRGVDLNRGLGTAQTDQFESHYHNYYSSNGSAGIALAAVRAATTGDNATATAAKGGSETRPRNIALLTCIKY